MNRIAFLSCTCYSRLNWQSQKSVLQLNLKYSNLLQQPKPLRLEYQYSVHKRLLHLLSNFQNAVTQQNIAENCNNAL